MKLVRMSGRNTVDKACRVAQAFATNARTDNYEVKNMCLLLWWQGSFCFGCCQPHVQKLFCKMMITNMCMRSPNSSKKWTDYSMLNLFLSILTHNSKSPYFLQKVMFWLFVYPFQLFVYPLKLFVYPFQLFVYLFQLFVYNLSAVFQLFVQQIWVQIRIFGMKTTE
mgnify:CR=1 FL=1